MVLLIWESPGESSSRRIGISPVFERMTGRQLVVEYAFSPDLKRRIEAGDPFDVAILPPDIADDLMGGTNLWLVRASTLAAPA
jgi:hypothetical protein